MVSFNPTRPTIKDSYFWCSAPQRHTLLPASGVQEPLVRCLLSAFQPVLLLACNIEALPQQALVWLFLPYQVTTTAPVAKHSSKSLEHSQKQVPTHSNVVSSYHSFYILLTILFLFCVRRIVHWLAVAEFTVSAQTNVDNRKLAVYCLYRR